ncbi:MAG: hypothetical protein LR011_12045 [Verrucomicrobia bacterium]|nr:hypothetical protein [Verrucomicrobiota bacterium]
MSELHDEHQNDQSGRAKMSVIKQDWECSKCHYHGRARTRLGRGLTSLDWSVFGALVLVAVAIFLVFMKEAWASIGAIVILTVAAIYFLALQFRPARTCIICPQCRKLTVVPKEHYTPLIPVSHRTKRKKSGRR